MRGWRTSLLGLLPDRSKVNDTATTTFESAPVVHPKHRKLRPRDEIYRFIKCAKYPHNGAATKIRNTNQDLDMTYESMECDSWSINSLEYEAINPVDHEVDDNITAAYHYQAGRIANLYNFDLIYVARVDLDTDQVNHFQTYIIACLLRRDCPMPPDIPPAMYESLLHGSSQSRTGFKIHDFDSLPQGFSSGCSLALRKLNRPQPNFAIILTCLSQSCTEHYQSQSFESSMALQQDGETVVEMFMYMKE
jgi:hypothetical protein